MTKIEAKATAAALAAIDAVKLSNKLPDAGHHQRLTVTSTPAEHEQFVAELQTKLWNARFCAGLLKAGLCT
ncbi:hypothetical protein [Teichococcus vastitatis]|uniref:Uncharacterized protein n=1 Tax=Teichococcus vastitatis TaxID=2307076 RepID=A0ABS9W9L2_9PROT|nr:hypothetical protein [Pseudoroseomonas vastitatis]MCI0755678.1 hypothetical protein [Pseudoroseomonas vastitatis]